VIESFTWSRFHPGRRRPTIRIEIDAKTPARIVDANREGAERLVRLSELAKEMGGNSPAPRARDDKRSRRDPTSHPR